MTIFQAKNAQKKNLNKQWEFFAPKIKENVNFAKCEFCAIKGSRF